MKPMKEKMPQGSVESLGTTSRRTPSLEDREINKNRERKRRAITKKIFSGLRMHGGYTLPKHCDTNQVLRELCNEAGWIVEPDGNTYRKGSKPDKPQDIVGRSKSASPDSSCQPSPGSSIHPSPASSSHTANNTFLQGTPVTPALCSSPKSPTISLVSSHQPVGGFLTGNAVVGGEGSSQMLSPLQSGTCTPAVPAGSDTDTPFPEVMLDEFAGRGSNDLELTVGTSKKRSKTKSLGNDAGKF